MGLFTKKQSNIPRRRLETSETPTQPSSSNVFMRNRTLTGVTSANIGVSPTDSDSSRRIHARHLSIHRRKVSSILMIVVLASMVLWVLISNFTASVTIGVQNAAVLSKPVDSLRYEKTIQEYLDSNPFSRLNFFLDQSALAAYVSDKLPEVSGVIEQGMVNVGQTKFLLTLRTPLAGWNIGGKQYFVDSRGVSFDLSYFATPDVQIVDNSGASPQTGTAIVSNRFLGFVGRVVASAKASGYTVTQAILPPGTTRELEVHLKNTTILVKLSVDRPAGEQIEDMSRALEHLVNQNITPTYIDVRVSGKAFYK